VPAAFFLVNTGALTITAVNAFGNTVTGGSGGGIANVTAKSPITVAANVVMVGDVILTAGEIADGPTFADKLTVNAGIKVESTGGDVVASGRRRHRAECRHRGEVGCRLGDAYGCFRRPG